MKNKRLVKLGVSVVIPTYRGSVLMEKNLPSVLNSLRNGDEVIMVDDGGFKETLTWLKKKFELGRGVKKDDFTLYKGKYKKGQKNIEISYVLNHTNLRFAANSNRGVELAVHPLIFLVNDDVLADYDTPYQFIVKFDNSYTLYS